MQLTAPAFLLIFLPISLLLTLPVPQKYRTIALSLVSALWYILANWSNPIGALAVLLLPLFVYAMVLPDPHRMPRIRLIFGTVLPLSLLLAARLLAEYGLESFHYPYGLTFVVLAAISATVDRLKGQCLRPRHFFELSAYLLFFPLLFLGPLMHYRHFQERIDHAAPSLDRFSTGVRLYMSGTIKYLAISAVLLRSFTQILAYSQNGLHYLIAVLLPLLSLAGFWFLLSGCTDISCGISYMYGFAYPHSHRVGFLTRDPFRLVFGAYHALYAYLMHYVIKPLSGVLRGLPGRVVSLLTLLLLYGLFFRTRPEILLFLLPLFLLLLLPTVWKKLKPPFRWPCRLLIVLASCLCLTSFTTAIFMDDPLAVFTLLRSLGKEQAIYDFYYILSTVLNPRYLLISLLLAAIYLPISYYREFIERRLKGIRLQIFHYTELILLFAGFLLTLVYFLPQFPDYANAPYLNLYL